MFSKLSNVQLLFSSSEMSYSVDDIINASPSSSTTSSSKQYSDKGMTSQSKSGGSNGSVKKKNTIKHSISKLFHKNKDKVNSFVF